MALKFLKLVAGRKQEESAITQSTGAGDASKIVGTDATGKIDPSFIPGEELTIVPASEALGAGDFVNFWSNAGATNVRKADATAAGKEADGYVIAAVAQGNNATVYTGGTNASLAGMTRGALQWLSAATPGGRIEVPPASAGNVVQKLGRAISPTEMTFEPDEGVILA